MVSSPLLLLFCAVLVGASPGRRLQDEAAAPPLWRKLQAKMNIEFCSKNTASELEPCKASEAKANHSSHISRPSLSRAVVFREMLREARRPTEDSTSCNLRGSAVVEVVVLALLAVVGAVRLRCHMAGASSLTIAMIIHEDSKSMYDEFCAKDGPKANSEICTNTELNSYLNSPLQLPNKRNV